MSDWSGFGPPEFGGHPVELEFSLESHMGPRWVAGAMRYRSGWLAVAEVEMETSFDHVTEILTATIDDGGEPLGQWVAEALFNMSSGLPSESDIQPPDELDLSLDALYWDFLGRCDIEHLRQLEEKERATTLMARRLYARHRSEDDAAEHQISTLYAQRRRNEHSKHPQIDEEIRLIEDEQAARAKQRRADAAKFSSELEDYEAAILGSLRNHGRLTRLFAVRWTVVSSLTPGSPSLHVPQSYSPLTNVLSSREDRSAYVTRDLIATSKDPRNRERPRPVTPQIRTTAKQSPQALGKNTSNYQKDSKSEKLARDRAVLDLLYQQWEKTDPAKFERERKMREQIAEFNRKRAAQKKFAADLALGQPHEAASVMVDAENIDMMNRQAADDVRQRERELVTLRHGNSRPPQRPNQTDDPLPQKSPVGDSSAGAIEPGQAELSAACVVTTDLNPLSETSSSAVPEIGQPADKRIKGAGAARTHVIVGDRVLLRLDDGNRLRLQYLILDDGNDPERGIITRSDPRAKAILGRNVGDRVSLDIAGRERFAVIETILNFNQRASD